MKINNYELISKEYALSDNEGTAYLAFKYIPLLIQQFSSGNYALDYGCGSGNSTRYLESIGLNVEGVDISNEMLEEAKSQGTNIPYKLIESAKLPYKDTIFDVVFSSFVLFEVSSKTELVKILDEIYRVLNHDGLFIFITGSEFLYSHNWLSLDVNFEENTNLESGQIAKVLLKDVDLVVYDYFWTDSDYEEVIRQTGFNKLLTLFPLGENKDGYDWKDEKKFPPYAIYVLKKV